MSDFADTLLPGGGEKLQGPQPSEEYRRKAEAYLRAHPLSRDQLDFVERIVRYIAKNGFIDITAETIQKEPFKGTKIQELFRGQVPTWQEILAKVKEISGNTGVA